MSTVYEEGRAQNVTLLEAGKNVITNIRTEDKDKYNAVQIGIRNQESGIRKSEADKKKKDGEYEVVREFRVDKSEEYKVGQEVNVDQFKKGDKVAVQSISKGKGYQGVVKRHGFSGGPASHGHRHALRSPGSIGSAFPERVMKGKKMAGRMGGENVTTKNLVVVMIDSDKNILVVRGAVAGNNGAIVRITN